MTNRKRPVKNLPTYYFVSAQGKTQSAWDSQLMTCSRADDDDTSLQILAKDIGQKCELIELLKQDDRKTNYASKITHPLFRRKNPCKLDGDKNKCELLMMISDANQWGY